MSTLAQLEHYRLREQLRLDRATPQSARNRLGQYATPSSLAADISKAVGGYVPLGQPVRLLEPCVGTGAFFHGLATVFTASRIERAVGFEPDKRYAEVASRLWGGVGLTVRVEDFAAAVPAEQFNLLVTNPPYVRHHHLRPEAKRRLAERVAAITGIRPSGLAGLHIYFPLLAHPWLANGAVAAWLIPSEFMDVNYGAALKSYLTAHVDLLRVHRFSASDVQFTDALVSSAVVIYRKAPPSGRPVLLTEGTAVSEPSALRSVDHCALSPPKKWGPLFTTPERDATDTGTDLPLGALFTVRRGLATGNNEFFILSRDEARRRQLPDRFLYPILPGPRHLRESVIESDPDGFPRNLPQLVLVDCRASEEQVSRQFPRLWEYFAEGRVKKVDRGYLTSRRTPWYAQEDRPPAPFLCPYMGRQRNGRGPFRFLWNKTRATAHNVYMLLYPKGALARLLRERPELYSVAFEALQQIDTGRIVTGGRVYGGGLHKVEPNELANVPAGQLASRLGLSASALGLFDTVV